jgi:hypothetical protein
VLRVVPIAYMPSPIPRQVGWNLFARTIPFASAFPRNRGGSAPASLFSGPAQRSLTLRPTRSPSRLSDPLHQRLQRSRCLHRCSDCYRVERTSSRAGIPPLWTSAFPAHPVPTLPVTRTYQVFWWLLPLFWRRLDDCELECCGFQVAGKDTNWILQVSVRRNVTVESGYCIFSRIVQKGVSVRGDLIKKWVGHSS